ncbi:hypothetical protein A0H81_03059 [Grifola frondosa]|uniref:Uncharacterized protein n=1 Tax=Grifola frondosa TaxID=5627 RepID=A0A1C7MKH5_GRIFR|nr:hypothetical protein A0H81_03059 [Grifola frondosa]
MQKPAGSPTAPRYAEAPIPDGIVYPGPPGKLGKRTPNVAAGVPLPPSPANTPSSPRRRRGSPVRHLSPLRFSTPQSQD